MCDVKGAGMHHFDPDAALLLRVDVSRSLMSRLPGRNTPLLTELPLLSPVGSSHDVLFLP
jgi:hypothetical protein